MDDDADAAIADLTYRIDKIQDDMVTKSMLNTFIMDLYSRLDTSFKAVGTNFSHIINRLDDIERRLDKLEGRSKTMEGDVTDIKKDVTSIKGTVQDTKKIMEDAFPRVFNMFESDGIDVANLLGRVDELEKSEGGT